AYTTTDCLIVSNPCFQMWFTDGWTTANQKYAESNTVPPTPGTWSVYPSAVMGTTSTVHGFVFKYGGIYYGFEGNGTPSTAFNVWESSDPVHFSQTCTGVLSAGPSNWDSGGVYNPYVWVANNVSGIATWFMLYEGANGSQYSTGLATAATACGPWAKDSGDPLLVNGVGSVSGPEVHQVGNTYCVFTHTSPSSNLPSDVSAYSTTDLHSYTASPKNSIVDRLLSDEGANLSVGQLADPSLVEVSGTSYLFDDATLAQSSGNMHINLRTTPHTLADLCSAVEH